MKGSGSKFGPIKKELLRIRMKSSEFLTDGYKRAYDLCRPNSCHPIHPKGREENLSSS
jgi:hypothetical protein